MRCHWCHKELEAIETEFPEYGSAGEAVKTYECPEVHCIVTMVVETKQIYSYILYWDHTDGRRFRIDGNRDHKLTDFLVKDSDRYYRDVLRVKRFLALKPNKEGILEGKAIFDKLKTYVLFS